MNYLASWDVSLFVASYLYASCSCWTSRLSPLPTCHLNFSIMPITWILFTHHFFTLNANEPSAFYLKRAVLPVLLFPRKYDSSNGTGHGIEGLASISTCHATHHNTNQLTPLLATSTNIPSPVAKRKWKISFWGIPVNSEGIHLKWTNIFIPPLY